VLHVWDALQAQPRALNPNEIAVLYIPASALAAWSPNALLEDK